MHVSPVIGPEFRRLLDEVTGGEADAFFEAVRSPRRIRFRFNRLKFDPFFLEDLLAWEGIGYQPFRHLPDCFEVIEGSVPVGKSLAHFLGGIYIQDPASMLPAWVLQPTAGEHILELCASPGSKTTQLADAVENRGCIVANDVSARRARKLIFNLRRTGVVNTLVTQAFGESFGNLYFEFFDKILLDAPCSALGTLQKSPEVLGWWTPDRSRRLGVQQRQLLHGGLKALRPGGRLVYSTCTLTPWENEDVIQDVLDRFPVHLEAIEDMPMPSSPGLSGFREKHYSEEMKRARRVYPHTAATEAFFVALLRKEAGFGRSREKKREPVEPPRFKGADERDVSPVLGLLANHFDFPPDLWRDLQFLYGQELRAVHAGVADCPALVPWLTAGLPVAHLRSDPPKLTTEGCHLVGAAARRSVVELTSYDELAKYVNRDDLDIRSLPSSSRTLAERGQVVVRFRGHPIGHAWLDEYRLLSRFPRSGWRFGPAR